MENIEYNLQFIAKKQRNVYLIGIFSTGRRVFDPKKHAAFIPKEEAVLRRQLFN